MAIGDVADLAFIIGNEDMVKSVYKRLLRGDFRC